MNQPSTILSPGRDNPPGRASVCPLAEEEDMSSLQALINILRKPQGHGCLRCLGHGTYLTGAPCEHCSGSGRRSRARSR